jgi:hypothetical protein
MHRPLALAALVLVTLAAPPAHAASHGRFSHELFTLRLPSGWFVADWKPAANGRRAVPARKPAAAATARIVTFADRRGNYLSIFVDHASDVALDAVWTVRAGKDGATVEVGNEGNPCDPANRAPTQGPCSRGNRTLEIGTLPALRLKGHTYGFEFGNTQKETGVPLETFRYLLQGFQAREQGPGAGAHR